MSDTDEFEKQFAHLSANVEKFIRGKTNVVRLALICLVAQGHLLIEDVPGVAKTSLAKAIGRSIAGATVKRIQFTPDLLPSDVVGVQIYDQGAHTFKFVEGPVFANIVIGDEINRASPKTQSSMLEVMAEQQVTIEGRSRRVPDPFLCIATQNPIEHQGTYVLPEAQLDRFMMRLKIGYPEVADEMMVVADGVARRSTEELQPVMTIDDLRGMIGIAQEVHVSEELRHYIVQIAKETRKHPDVRLGVSPRASIAVAAAAQAYAAARGGSFVNVDDVKAVVQSVLVHRLLLRPEARVRGQRAERIIEDLVNGAAGIPVPRSRRS